jgi:hypothetical protein
VVGFTTGSKDVQEKREPEIREQHNNKSSDKDKDKKDEGNDENR